MKPKRVDLLTGLFNHLGVIEEASLHPEAEKARRAAALNDELHGGLVEVDTVFVNDTGYHETGIRREKVEGKWVIVEQYPDKSAAALGHEKWVKILTEYPDFPLEDIDLWSLNSTEPEEVK